MSWGDFHFSGSEWNYVPRRAGAVSPSRALCVHSVCSRSVPPPAAQDWEDHPHCRRPPEQCRAPGRPGSSLRQPPSRTRGQGTLICGFLHEQNTSPSQTAFSSCPHVPLGRKKGHKQVTSALPSVSCLYRGGLSGELTFRAGRGGLLIGLTWLA